MCTSFCALPRLQRVTTPQAHTLTDNFLARKNSVPNAGLNPLRPDSLCPLRAGTGHGRPGRAPGRCGCVVTSLLHRAVEGPFADNRTSVLPSSSCRVCGTWREGRGGGTVGGVGVLRARRCHLRGGFQQCKSFVEWAL